jgi:hypothetical protein
MNMTGYSQAHIGLRIVAASVTMAAAFFGVLAANLVALWMADAGGEAPVIVLYAVGFGAMFAGAFLITAILIPPPRVWAAVFIGLGAVAGLLLADWLGPLPASDMDKALSEMVLTLVLTFLGALAGTCVPPARSAFNRWRGGRPAGQITIQPGACDDPIPLDGP